MAPRKSPNWDEIQVISATNPLTRTKRKHYKREEFQAPFDFEVYVNKINDERPSVVMRGTVQVPRANQMSEYTPSQSSSESRDESEDEMSISDQSTITSYSSEDQDSSESRDETENESNSNRSATTSSSEDQDSSESSSSCTHSSRDSENSDDWTDSDSETDNWRDYIWRFFHKCMEATGYSHRS